MTATPEEIQKKEESLFALMQKVLHKPLQPLSESIDKIKTELDLSQKEIIKNIINESGASAESIEKIEKSLRNIQSQATNIKSEIERYHSAQSEATQNLVSSISAHALDHAKHLQSASDELLAAFRTSSQQHTQLTSALKTWSEDLQQAHATLLEKQTSQAQAAQQDIAQMRADLTQKIAASDAEMTKQMKSAQATLLTELGSSMQTLVRVQITQTDSHSALVHSLDEQRTALSQQLMQVHSKLRLLTGVVGMLLACTLIRMGYDIWHLLR